jgi:hypothetical protein
MSFAKVTTSLTLAVSITSLVHEASDGVVSTTSHQNVHGLKLSLRTKAWKNARVYPIVSERSGDWELGSSLAENNTVGGSSNANPISTASHVVEYATTEERVYEPPAVPISHAGPEVSPSENGSLYANPVGAVVTSTEGPAEDNNHDKVDLFDGLSPPELWTAGAGTTPRESESRRNAVIWREYYASLFLNLFLGACVFLPLPAVALFLYVAHHLSVV